MKEQRLVVDDQVVVEGEAARDRGDRNADPVDARLDLVDARTAALVGDHISLLPWMAEDSSVAGPGRNRLSGAGSTGAGSPSGCSAARPCGRPDRSAFRHAPMAAGSPELERWGVKVAGNGASKRPGGTGAALTAAPENPWVLRDDLPGTVRLLAGRAIGLLHAAADLDRLLELAAVVARVAPAVAGGDDGAAGIRIAPDDGGADR